MSNFEKTFREIFDSIGIPRAPTFEQPAQQECDSPELCKIAKVCAGQFGTKRICGSSQPAQQEPVAVAEVISNDRHALGEQTIAVDQPLEVGTVLYTAPPASKPVFKAFAEWANAAGYDTAHTHDGIKWVCLNPMTADLWKAWQAAYGIKEQS